MNIFPKREKIKTESVHKMTIQELIHRLSNCEKFDASRGRATVTVHYGVFDKSLHANLPITINLEVGPEPDAGSDKCTFHDLPPDTYTYERPGPNGEVRYARDGSSLPDDKWVHVKHCPW